MEIQDLKFTPHSDASIDNVQAITQHRNLISQGNYGDAKTLVNNYDKGFTASLFNALQNKIRTIQLYLLNEYVAEPEEYYSDTEPDPTFMEENGYVFWIQPF